MSEIKLKPCPFCGADAQLYVIPYGGLTPLYDVECTRCSARIGRSKETYQASKGYLHFTNEQEAAEAWNQRAERRGHWIKKNGIFECSECGMWVPHRSDYCRDCGAKMYEGVSE